MDITLRLAAVWLLSGLLCHAQAAAVVIGQQTAHVVMSMNSASNISSGGDLSGIAPVRSQHGNYATGCTAGLPTPSSYPTGQLYATAALATLYSGVGGCPVQSSPTTTASGTGIAAVDNGNGAGGTDSATALTDTYGDTAFDSVCTGDTYAGTPTLYPGLAPAACVANSSQVASETTVAGHPNSSVLFSSLYQSNSVMLDKAFFYYRDYYFRVVSSSTVRNAEFDVNVNSSPTLYTACGTTLQGDCGYFGWGTDYSYPVTAWRYCPQNCSAWKIFKMCDVAGSGCVSTYTVTSNQWYHVRQYGHRNSNCTYGSAVNCYFYDYMTIYPVGVSAPVTYALYDSTGIPAGGIPINHNTWAAGQISHTQIDRTDTNGGAGELDLANDQTYIFTIQ